MTIRHAVAAVGAVAAFTAVGAHAADTGWYGGLQLGRSSSGLAGSDIDGAHATMVTTATREIGRAHV